MKERKIRFTIKRALKRIQDVAENRTLSDAIKLLAFGRFARTLSLQTCVCVCVCVCVRECVWQQWGEVGVPVVCCNVRCFCCLWFFCCGFCCNLRDSLVGCPGGWYML